MLAACGDATHTVGELAPARGRDNLTANAMAGSNGGGSANAGSGPYSPNGSAGSALPGDVSSRPDGGAVNPFLPPLVPVLDQPDFSCRGGSTPATRRRLDLYLMIDTNLFYAVGTTITQPLNSAFTQIKIGLSEYVDSPEASGTGVGAGYFPAAVTVPGALPACDAGSYDSPVTPVELLPANAQKIKDGVPAPLGVGSPTLAALQGALAYEHSRAESWTYKQAIVLITDRIADFACLNDDPNAIVNAARSGATMAPGIPTYVIALSSPRLEDVLSKGLLGAFVKFEGLDDVAAQGGTGAVRAVDLDDRNDSLSRALLDVQHDAEPCQYEVGPEVAANPTGIALGTVAAGTDPLPLPRVGAIGQCGMGYYLDDPAQPKWATLCKDTCTTVKAQKRTVVWIDDCDVQ